MSWAAGEIVGFDTETTGIDVHRDRIVTATIVKLDAAGDVLGSRSWLINPGIEIPAGAAAIHGVTTERAQAEGVEPGPAIEAIAATVTGFLRAGIPVAAFNAAYDFSILTAECERHGLAVPTARVGALELLGLVDPFVLERGIDSAARRFIKGRKYRLPDCCARRKVAFTESHQADADAIGAARLAQAIARDEEHIAAMGPQQLYTFQQTHHAARQRSFRDWKLQQGEPADDISTDWPIIPAADATTAVTA